MQPPVKYKDVEINGRKFRVRKFPARVGSFMIIKLTAILAPMFAGIKQNLKAKSADDIINMDDIDITGVLEQLNNLSEKDFDYIQEKALSVCYETLPAGLTPVLHANGAFGVEDLEDDTVTVMALTVHALTFNLTSFFQGSGIKGLVKGLVSSPQD
ncbi:phage tail assembly chaperone [Brevibacillus laterosporus]|uniref:Phage tail assembly protein n=1 Tax=Brevibacillus laterosporus TaxID=1465 RepID=A0AAP3GBW6_BRELA|nr:hypothetical protein [Brevibacillus laterosporus]MBG9773568.1 hypothetical protein [Brevibacillus laterosporus]MCR8981647.1 hypothetical protein [Brevibacillus laterosporus]MCZ0808802.1 hypothetical protein [Brevibacillus laterosporus]MCZ0827225.1 hypothetical protein [Brevibacillus laterosporus]MCZ0850981.1 hypothetical protein [Brevibacillus laterosporus]